MSPVTPALALSILFASVSFSQAHPHDGGFKLANYKWAHADSKATLQIPYSNNTKLNQGLHSRVNAIAKKSFDKNFYVPSGAKDSEFSSKMNAFYKAQKTEAADIPVPGPVFTYDFKTAVLTNTADIVSLQLSTDSMTKGAAHPSRGGGFINYDPKTLVFLDDLSFLKSEAKKRIFEQVKESLEGKLKDGMLTTEDDLRKLLPHHFGFRDGQLFFSFAPGEVAPYVYGPQTAVVPFNDVDRK